VVGVLFLLGGVAIWSFDQPIIALYVLIIGGAFAIAWTIVGGLIVWRYSYDCSLIEYSLWAMATADVVIPLMVIPLSGILTCLAFEENDAGSVQK
jgi:hypothetical protein